MRGVNPPLLDARFEVVARRRPVALVQPGTESTAGFGAPYVAVEAPLDADGRATLALTSGPVTLRGQYDGRATLWVDVGRRTSRHRSRRHARPRVPVEAVGLTLTGTHLTLLTREAGSWVGRARVDLADRVDTRDEAWLAGLRCEAGAVAGTFGQLGLRDLRLVSDLTGEPCREPDGRLLLTATSAGPGFFDTAHTSVWALDPAKLELAHRADLFFRRAGRATGRPGVFGDHATHLVRDDGRRLVATSTWGDFDRRRPMGVVLAESTADLTRGRHVLDARPLALPTTGLRSVGVWDPHLARDGERWLVGYVSARRYFRFHPVLAAGPDLDALEVLGADPRPRESEGTTLVRDGERWLVAASDKHRREYPVRDLAMARVGALAAPYPTNIPWPTVAREGAGWLLVAFDGTPCGGPLLGYGTHGEVVLMRSAARVTGRRAGGQSR